VDLLTVQEAARMLKVAPITIRRQIASGRLPAVRVGRGVRVRSEALHQVLTPVAQRAERRPASAPRGRPTGPDDPLWAIVGIARSDGPGDVSEHKHRYLAEAHAAEAR
jgi:excisionase family DNA binding protein